MLVLQPNNFSPRYSLKKKKNNKFQNTKNAYTESIHQFTHNKKKTVRNTKYIKK